jgi:methionyl aminopeptidase
LPCADHWTQVTGDGKPSAHFEHTIAVTEHGVRVMTAPPTEEELRKIAP